MNIHQLKNTSIYVRGLLRAVKTNSIARYLEAYENDVIQSKTEKNFSHTAQALLDFVKQ